MLKQIGSVVMILFLFKAAKAEMINSEVLLKRANSTVTVYSKSPDGEKMIRGTGFFISSDLIMTNYHVIENSFYKMEYTNDVDVLDYNGKKYSTTKIELIDARNDMAIIRIAGAFSKFFIDIEKDRVDSYEIKNGEKSFVLGYPAFSTLEVNPGLFITTANLFEENEVSISGRNLQSGASGSPVLDSKGRIAGLFKSVSTIGSDLNTCPKRGYIGYLTNSEIIYDNYLLLRDGVSSSYSLPLFRDFHHDRVKSSLTMH